VCAVVRADAAWPVPWVERALCAAPVEYSRPGAASAVQPVVVVEQVMRPAAPASSVVPRGPVDHRLSFWCQEQADGERAVTHRHPRNENRT
jgi:hypothetical protein